MGNGWRGTEHNCVIYLQLAIRDDHISGYYVYEKALPSSGQFSYYKKDYLVGEKKKSDSITHKSRDNCGNLLNVTDLKGERFSMIDLSQKAFWLV